MGEDKARDRVPSIDSARERNAVFRPQVPAVARMGFFNGLLALPGVDVRRQTRTSLRKLRISLGGSICEPNALHDTSPT